MCVRTEEVKRGRKGRGLKWKKHLSSQTGNLFFFGGPSMEKIKKAFLTKIDKLTIVYGCISDGG